MIPAERMDKLNAALEAADYPTATDVILPPDSPQIPNVARHPGEHYIAFMDSERIEDSAKRNAIQGAVASEGFTICAHGAYWKEPPAPKADSRKKTTATSAAAELTNTEQKAVEEVRIDAAEPEADGVEVELESTSTPEAAPDVRTEQTTAVAAAPPADLESVMTIVNTADAPSLMLQSIAAAPPAKPRKVATIVQDIQQAALTELINDDTAHIICTWGNGNALNVAYYREVAE